MNILRNQIQSEQHRKPLIYDAYYRQDQIKKPIILFCHGYKGFKDWGAWDPAARKFADAGFFFVKFNFSHNGGTLEQPIDFPDPEAFGKNTFSLEMDDLYRITHHIANKEEYKEEVEQNNISLIGHSRGGGISLIFAEENHQIKKVVTWAGISDFEPRFQIGTPYFDEWKKNGITFIENSRTKQQLPHEFQFYEDYQANKDRFTIKRAVENLDIPQLIIHGDEDKTVALSEAQKLHQWNPDSILKTISGADHVFGAHHPWEKMDMPFHLQEAVNLTLKFLKEDYHQDIL